MNFKPPYRPIYGHFILTVILMVACKTMPEPMLNTYVSQQIEVKENASDKNEFVEIYEKIIVKQCAVSACHGGAFEPNFTSMQSSYSSLVNHPIVKNNNAKSFFYRVVPGDTNQSVLYERITNCCFVNKDDRMPQSNIGSRLPQEDIDAIGRWIMNGAKNMFGIAPENPDSPPRVSSMKLKSTTNNIDFAFKDNRHKKISYESMLLPRNDDYKVILEVWDDNTEIGNLKDNVLLISTDRENFSNPSSFTAKHIEGKIWEVDLDLRSFPLDQVYYLRYSVGDGVNSENTLYPNPALFEFEKHGWSFILKK